MLYSRHFMILFSAWAVAEHDCCLCGEGAGGYGCAAAPEVWAEATPRSSPASLIVLQ